MLDGPPAFGNRAPMTKKPRITDRPTRKDAKPRAKGVSAASLACLHSHRISADPVRNKAQARLTGLGGVFATYKLCAAIARSTGKPCRQPAAWGTAWCKSHAKRGGKDVSDWIKQKRQRNRERKAARVWLDEHQPPVELTRHPAWIATEETPPGVGYPRRYALALAWQTGTETGDWKAWQALTK